MGSLTLRLISAAFSGVGWVPSLLRTRRERPRDRRAAECDQQFAPSDGDCHTPLPREVRKGNDSTPTGVLSLTERQPVAERMPGLGGGADLL